MRTNRNLPPLRVVDVMTVGTYTVPGESTLVNAAQIMRDNAVGSVLVNEDLDGIGILTDRDIVIRAVAFGMDSITTEVDSVCSRDVFSVDREMSAEYAMLRMRQIQRRRLPVVEDGIPIGMVSLGDLAAVVEPQSALGEIRASAPNNPVRL